MTKSTSTSNSRLPKGDRPHPFNELPPEWNYEATVAQVDAIITQIEQGDLDLAAVFDQFAIAVQHLQQCDAFLQHHRQQVDLLIETLDDSPESSS